MKFMVQQYQANKLIGQKTPASSGRVIALTNALYTAVGLTPPNFSPEALGDANNFGNGLFTPGTQAVIRTGNGEGGTVIPPNGFNQPTLITIFLRSTSGFPSPPQPVFAPFYEITASNAAGTHYLTTGQLAVVGFCADADFLESLGDPAIAHQAVNEGEGNPGGFEILDDATAAQYNSLGLSCPQAPARLGALDVGSFKGFAMSAWEHAAHYAGPVLASALLPDEAQAAAAMLVGKSGLGGLARSLSPFAVTDRPSEFENTLDFGNDPGDQTFNEGEGSSTHLTWCPGCEPAPLFPKVILRDGESTPIGGVQVTVELIRTGETTTGNLTDGSTTVVFTNSDASFGNIGEALFDDLFVENVSNEGADSCEGTYKLEFTAEGAAPRRSGEFTVSECGF